MEYLPLLPLQGKKTDDQIGNIAKKNWAYTTHPHVHYFGNLLAKITYSVPHCSGVLGRSFHRRAFDLLFKHMTKRVHPGLAGRIRKPTCFYITFQSIKTDTWSPFVSLFFFLSTDSNLGRSKKELRSLTSSKPNILDCKLPQGKNPSLSCLLHGL